MNKPLKKNEVAYYPEIQDFISAQLKSNFRAALSQELYIYWGIGELKTNLQRIIQSHPQECNCAKTFTQQIPPLNLDIFALVTNGVHFQLIILEVKLVKAAGLNEWSQLIGYCLVSGAKYGLLLNINNGASTRLSDLLYSTPHVSNIITSVDSQERKHLLGFMEWNSLTKNFEYSDLGAILSLSELSRSIISDFEVQK